MNATKTIFTLLLAAAGAAHGQTKVTVSGTAGEGATTVYIYDDLNLRGTPDSVAVSGGRWRYEAEKGAGQYVMALVDDKGRKLAAEKAAFILAEGGPTSVDLSTGEVTGPKASVAFNTTLHELLQLSTQAKSREAEEKALALMRRSVMDNLNSMLPAVFVPLIAETLTAGDLQAILQPTAPYYALPEMGGAKERLAFLTGNSVRSVGRMFTDLTLPDADGRSHSLSEWCGKGRYVLIDFWASWCGPCRMEMPNVVECYRKYRDKDFTIIAISLDERREPWIQAVESMGMTWTNLSDLKGWRSLAAQTYNIRSIPANILLGPDGKIIDVDLRGAMLAEKLAELFK